MPALIRELSAEDIDEEAARRSARVTMMVLGALVPVTVLAGFAIAFFLRPDRPSAGVQERMPLWAIVFVVAFLAVFLAASAWLMRRQYRRPVYRRVMQFGFQRRRHAMKALLRGGPMSADDMPVAAAMVGLQRSQGRWTVILLCLLPVISLFQGVINHGPMRWFQLGTTASLVVMLPLALSQRRKIIRNYERLVKDGKQ